MDLGKLTRNFSAKELLLLKILVFFLFLGRAWQGLFWDLPLRTFFWDQSMLEGIVTYLTADTWQNYVTNKSVDIDAWINRLGFLMGCFWLCCALLALLIKNGWKWTGRILNLAAFSLFLLALLYFKDGFMALGQFFEFSIQITAPLILVYAVSGGVNTPSFRMVVKLIIAITFVSHGLYAMGYYPVPGKWVQWCMNILRLSNDESAMHFLMVIGFLDFWAAACLFAPFTFRFGIV